MTSYTSDQLREILAQHARWRRGEGGARANLSRADLCGADLSRANLSGVYVALNVKATAAPARRATRSDGYEFFLWPTDAGWRVRAGCRFFTMDEAWLHWTTTRADTPLGDESLDILTMFDLHIERVGGAS